jgi:hypothetical protein
MTTSEKAEIKTCESCGEPFGCGAKLDGCWCVDVELAPAIANDLMAKYTDCLCPKCLEISMRANFDN